MTMALPEFLQTKTYAAMRLRQVLLDLPIQEGVVGATDLKVTQRAAGGANLSIDVAAGSGYVRGDTTSRQGLYHTYNDAVVNLAIGTNTSGNPRIDQVIMRVYDSQDGLAGSDQATLEILPGSPQAGATLDNRSGAAVLPLSCVRLADIVVASGASSITNANIRDRRPWAHGAFSSLARTAGDFTSAATSATLLHTDLERRLEISTGLVECHLSGTIIMAAVAYSVIFNVGVDGTVQQDRSEGNTGTLLSHFVDLRWTTTVTAGSRVIAPYQKANAANTTTFSASATAPLQFTVEEILRPNANNS